MQELLSPISLSNKLFDQISAMITASYPNACLCYIEKIDNTYLTERYQARKADLILKRGAEVVKELMLFHGTKFNNINNIVLNGFKASFNKVSAYGRGTYFSTTANYSQNYSTADPNEFSYMFISNVIVASCILGTSGKEIDTELYDNMVDNITKPSMYVTPYDDGCIPVYMVAFHKNAR